MAETIDIAARIDVSALRRFVAGVIEQYDVPHDDAETVADVLVTADLRGINSHGVARLGRYVNGLKSGLMKAHPNVRIINETAATAAYDADDGLGHPVGKRAMEHCIRKAKESGAAFVTVRRSNHYGIAGYYSMMALPHDCIGISMTNSAPLVTPTHGVDLMLGTNPISFTTPCASSRPFVLDMATSVVPRGKVEVYDRMGKELPVGWAVDPSGNPATNPAQLLDNMMNRRGGGLLPLGGLEEFSGYKGYGLAVMVDILCGVLSGAAYGPVVDEKVGGKPAPSNVGHFFGCVNVGAFRPLDEFKAEMDTMLQQLRDSRRAEGEDRIYIHGEKEFEAADENEREGVPLEAKVIETLRKLGAEVGLELPALK